MNIFLIIERSIYSAYVEKYPEKAPPTPDMK